MKPFGIIITTSLFLGVFFVYFVGGYSLGFGWTIFFLILGGVGLYLLKQSDFTGYREGLLLVVSALLLALSHSIWDQKHFVVINALATFPLLVMGLYAIYHKVSHIPQKFLSFFLTGLGDYFHSCFGYWGKIYENLPTLKKPNLSSEKSQWFTAQHILGVLGGLLLLVVIVPLLNSADPMFARILGDVGNWLAKLFTWNISFDWLADINFGKIILGALVATITGAGLLLLTSKKTPTFVSQDFGTMSQSIYNIMTGMICVVYILFAIVQLKYLFLGSTLPDGLTYSQYAVKGFWQLLIVLSINLLVFLICPKHGNTPTKIISFTLFITSCLIWLSCLMRLKMYIDVYQLTWMRLLPRTFSMLLIVLLSLVYLATMRQGYHRLNIIVYGVIIWYVVLNLIGVDWIIAYHNVYQAKHTQREVDYNYLVRELSDDVFYVLDDSHKTLRMLGYEVGVDGRDYPLYPTREKEWQGKSISSVVNE